MLKQIILSITIILLNLQFIIAKTTDVATGLSFPIRLAINRNELYISEYGTDSISKIDITATPEGNAPIEAYHGLLKKGRQRFEYITFGQIEQLLKRFVVFIMREGTMAYLVQ
jgi:hypothetical protein